jgi:hypothetical protein
MNRLTATVFPFFLRLKALFTILFLGLFSDIVCAPFDS